MNGHNQTPLFSGLNFLMVHGYYFYIFLISTDGETPKKRLYSLEN